MKLFHKRYDRKRAAWYYMVALHPEYNLKQERLNLKRTIQRVQPAFDSSFGRIRCHGTREQIRKLDEYLALSGWVEKQQFEKTWQALGGNRAEIV